MGLPFYYGHSSGTIPLDVAEIAAFEAGTIWRDDTIAFGNMHVDKLLTKSGIEVIYLYPHTQEDTELLYEVAPNITNVITNLSQQHTTTPGLLPPSLSINSVKPGQKMLPHKDKRTGLTRIANLRASGRFFIMDPVDGNIFDFETTAGDVHEFDNPAEKDRRPYHWSENTDEVNRIVISFTL